MQLATIPTPDQQARILHELSCERDAIYEIILERGADPGPEALFVLQIWREDGDPDERVMGYRACWRLDIPHTLAAARQYLVEQGERSNDLWLPGVVWRRLAARLAIQQV